MADFEIKSSSSRLMQLMGKDKCNIGFEEIMVIIHDRDFCLQLHRSFFGFFWQVCQTEAAANALPETSCLTSLHYVHLIYSCYVKAYASVFKSRLTAKRTCNILLMVTTRKQNIFVHKW